MGKTIAEKILGTHAGHDVKAGDFVLASVDVMMAAGIRVVIAKSYARSFYRNAVNLGLLVLEADTDPIEEGDVLEFDQSGFIHDLTKGEKIQARPFAPLIKEILDAGGIIAYMERKYPARECGGDS